MRYQIIKGLKKSFVPENVNAHWFQVHLLFAICFNKTQIKIFLKKKQNNWIYAVIGKENYEVK